uniref:TAFH domain-containing protein n=1 Tax=Panagrellus redivivus TaxID=6233 RepID=A0A7E4V017_PANRE
MKILLQPMTPPALTQRQFIEVHKLGRLLDLMIRTAAKQGSTKEENMKALVLNLVHSEMSVSEFTVKYKEILGPNENQLVLLEFCESALPILRTEIRSDRLKLADVITFGPVPRKQ